MLYDVLWLLRRLTHAGRVMTGALDLCFGAALAVMMTAAGLRLCVDPFRLYLFAGVFAGWAVYACTMGLALRKVYAGVQRIVKKVPQMPEK